MGKKNRKKRNSLLNDSTSHSFQSKGDSSLSSLNFSNLSLNESTSVPENLLVSSVESAGCEIYAKCLKSEWENVVFLHPAIMRAYNIQDLVLVSGENTRTLCVARPLEYLKKSFIVFPKNDCAFKHQEFISVKPYEGKVLTAEEIVVSCSSDESISDKVRRLILRLLSTKYIYVGLSVQWKLFDSEYQCTVKNITCLQDSGDLSLNETSVCDAPVFYKTFYKTILTTESQTVQDYAKNSTVDHIGGLDSLLKTINKRIQVFLSEKNCTSSEFYWTLMLHGLSGTGKSLCLDKIAKEYSNFVQHIIWYRIYSLSQSEREKELRSVFQQAIKRAPSIIIIDDFNRLCPSKHKAENLHLLISKTLSQLVKTLDDSKVLIIAASNNSDYDDSVLKTSRRLMEVLQIQLPSTIERVDILKKLLDAEEHQLTFEEIQDCAGLAHGFTGKDLLVAINNALLLCCKRKFPATSVNNDMFHTDVRDGSVGPINYCDLKLTIKLRKPTIVAANDLKVKKVQWSDIGGMNCVIIKLKQIVESHLKYPKLYKAFDRTPSRGILMYGPPGCSKTMLAKALANECDWNFISRNASELYNKYVGESERAVRELFAMAKDKAPCVIFLDEIDALVNERGSSCGSSGVGNRIVAALLIEMDGIEELHYVLVLAATNRPDRLDSALVRQGRINEFIYVPLPDAVTREEIIRISMKNRSVSEDFDIKLLSEKTDGYSGAEIVNICNEAALQLMEEDPMAKCPIFRFDHFERALKCVLPRTSKEMIHFYENFNKNRIS